MKKFIVLNEDYTELVGGEYRTSGASCTLITKVTKNKLIIKESCLINNEEDVIHFNIEIPLILSDQEVNTRLNIHGFNIKRYNNVETIDNIEVFREKLILLDAKLIFDERLGEFLFLHKLKGLGQNFNSLSGFQKYYKILIDFDKIKDKLEESDYLIKR